MSDRPIENADYAAAERKMQIALSNYAAGTHTDPDAPPTSLQPQSVFIEGAPRQNRSFEGGFVERMGDYAHGDKRDRLDVTVDFSPPRAAAGNDQAAAQDNAPVGTDLRALQEGQLRKAALAAFKDVLAAVPLKDGSGTVADKIDFSGEPAEATKPYKDQVADLKKLVDKGIEEAQGNIPADVVALLRHAKTFDTDKGSVFGYATEKPDVTQGHVETTFLVSKKDEGETSNPALAVANLNARKDEILAAVREAAITAHAAAPATTPEGMAEFKADLSKLDMQVDMANGEYGGRVTVRFGNKVHAPADAKEQASGEKPVGKTVLATLSEDTLSAIVNDSVLLKGKDADKVAHLLAGDNDVERMLVKYKDAAPSFAEAVKSDVMVNSLPWEEREKEHEKISRTAKIVPSVTVDTSDGGDRPNNKLRINIDLPEGITHSDVIAALAGKSAVAAKTQDAAVEAPPPVVGPATERLAKETQAPLLTTPPPVLGDATKRVAEGRTAPANDQAAARAAG